MDKQMSADVIRATKFIHHRVESIVTARLAHNDITAAQSHVLIFILRESEKNGVVTPTDIHKKLNISRATVSGLIKKLRASGYITLEGCDDDERQRRIAVTEKAHMHMAEIESCMGSIENNAFRDFSQEELEELHRLIHKMANNISSIDKGERKE